MNKKKKSDDKDLRTDASPPLPIAKNNDDDRIMHRVYRVVECNWIFINYKRQLTLIMSAQVGCAAVLEVGDFFVVGLVAFLADIVAIYDYEICLEDVLKDDRRME